jgi:hypothetical protein
MSSYSTVADLFQYEPGEWGLRGDPYLWAEMQVHLSGVPLPSNPEELKELLVHSFHTLTGNSLSSRKYFYVERFAHGGMSSGHIDPTFWRNKVIPLLMQRFSE